MILFFFISIERERERGMDFAAIVLILLILLLAFSQAQAIWQGGVANWEEYPYVARLFIYNKSLCTGVAVGNKAILTAAHCLAGVPPDEIQITLGNGQKLNAKAVHINTAYDINKASHEQVYADVALIELEDNEKAKVSVPIQYTNPLQVDISESILAGFGYEDNNDTGIDVFRTGRATVYDRGYEYSSVAYKGENLCDSFQGNLSFFESMSTSCKRCNLIPNCSCSTNGVCVKDGSESMVSSILGGDSGGALFYLNEGIVQSVIGISSAVYKGYSGSNESFFAKTSQSEDFLRKTMVQIDGSDGAASGKAELIPPRPLPLFFNVYLVAFLLMGVFILFLVMQMNKEKEKSVTKIDSNYIEV